MCGIFGLLSSVNNTKFKAIVKQLFILSENRGKEASGFAFLPCHFSTSHFTVFKSPLPANKIIKSSEFNKVLHNTVQSGLFIGHSRLVTNGCEHDNSNNQPFVKNGIVGIHNGIVTNVEELWQKHRIKPDTKLDSEIFPSLLYQYKTEGFSLSDSIKKIFSEIEGMANIAMGFSYLNNLLLATNNGSIYYVHLENTFIFA